MKALPFVSFVIPFFALTCIQAEDPEAPHEWNDKSGSFSVEASFVELVDEKVVIRKSDGGILKVPLASLSKEDVEYVNEITNPGPTVEKIAGVWGGKWGDEQPVFLIIRSEGGIKLSLDYIWIPTDGSDIRSEPEIGQQREHYFSSQSLLFRKIDDHLLVYHAAGRPRGARMVKLKIQAEQIANLKPEHFQTINLEEHGWIPGVDSGNTVRAQIIKLEEEPEP
tara:strand:+ start:2781 stop:3449 length:669 start_codon:yes stop_codon:yes gene_type:complete